MPKGREGLKGCGTTAAYGEIGSVKFFASDGSAVAKFEF
jgi:hypothetical protein